MLPNFDRTEMPRALQNMQARGRVRCIRHAAAPQLPEAGRCQRPGARCLPAPGHGAGQGRGGHWPEADPTALGLRADRPQRRGHGHHQPAGVRPGCADRPADDPGRGTRRRLEPGAQPQRLRRCGLPRPAVRHPPHRRFALDQEQLHAVPRTRRARPGDAAVRRGGALERGREHAAHAGRHGARPGRPQGGLRRTGRGRDGLAGAREGHAEEPEGLPHHRPAHHAPGCACQEQRAAGLRHRHAPARPAHRRGGASAGVRRQAHVGGRQRGARHQGRQGRAAHPGGPRRRRRGRGGRRLLARQAGARRAQAAVEHRQRREGRQRTPAGPVPRTGRPSPARAPSMPTWRRWPARRASWKPSSSSPTWPMHRWSR